jgi:serine/threonine protein kinase
MNSRPKDKNQRNGNLIQLIDDMTKEENHERLKLPVVIESVKSFNLTPQGKLEEPKDSKSGNIKFSREFILGEGNYGKVHLGLWGGSIAAVKRILISLNDDIVIERENELQKLNHRNVVRFYDSEQDSDFK